MRIQGGDKSQKISPPAEKRRQYSRDDWKWPLTGLGSGFETQVWFATIVQPILNYRQGGSKVNIFFLICGIRYILHPTFCTRSSLQIRKLSEMCSIGDKRKYIQYNIKNQKEKNLHMLGKILGGGVLVFFPLINMQV